MNNQDFLQRLNAYIRYVFDHESDFMFEFFREYPGFVIDMFYMGSERCFVGLERPEDGEHSGDSISTDRFIAWVDKSNDTMQ